MTPTQWYLSLAALPIGESQYIGSVRYVRWDEKRVKACGGFTYEITYRGGM